MMGFTKAMETISNGINYLYEENIEDINAIEEAEMELELLVNYLKMNGVDCLADLARRLSPGA